MMDDHYVRFFTESGYEVAKLHRIDCQTTLAIAMVDEIGFAWSSQLWRRGGRAGRHGFGHGAPGRRSRAVVGKPVLAINAVMLWHALRARGIEDRLFGFGSILREH